MLLHDVIEAVRKSIHKSAGPPPIPLGPPRKLSSDGEPLKVPGIIPKLSATPGAIRTAAPKLGQHTDEVLHDFGYSAQEIASLRHKEVI